MAGLLTKRLLIFKFSKLRRRCFLSLDPTARYNLSSTSSSLLKADKAPKLTDQEVNLNTDPDTFGTLTPGFKARRSILSAPPEEGDVLEKGFYDGRVGKSRLSTKKYADLIKSYLSQKRLVDALDVLEVKMLKEDRAKPENYIYNLLIDGCAKAGYTKKAFQLYNQMKKRGLKVTGATYTSLFNACSLSPVPGDGLARAANLRDLIVEKGILLNQTNYHAMIKAFGHCGDIATAFSLVDEMITKQIPLTVDTYCFLLQACISDKASGFRHALILWRKMREKRVKPTLYAYNLMLRCTRDCSIGDMDSLQSVLSISSKSNIESSDDGQTRLTAESIKLEGPPASTDLTATHSSHPAVVTPKVPNLLSVEPDFGTVVSVGPIQKPKHRLMLLGGASGFLDQMAGDKVSPDIKTFNLLLSIIPSTSTVENDLLAMMDKCGVKVNIEFCNALIHKRVKRGEFTSAKEVLLIISKARLQVNIMTFGVLALACRTTKEAKQLLIDLEEAGFRVNMEILGGLLYAARHSWNLSLMLRLLEIVTEEEMRPSRQFIEQIEKFKSYIEQQVRLKESGSEYHKKIDDEVFKKMYEKFNLRYSMWLKCVEVDDSDKIHPWKQFKKQTVKN